MPILSESAPMYMGENPLRIPKREQTVVLWVHPDGPVIGALFLHMPEPDRPEGETPWHVMNQPEPFLAVKRDGPGEPRFYNKASIIRVEYQEDAPAAGTSGRELPCRLHMMDGSLIDGAMRRSLPPERSRLYDYMNAGDERFMALHTAEGCVCLINKSYIVCISTRDEDR